MDYKFPEISAEINDQVMITNHLSQIDKTETKTEIYKGLTSAQKYLPSKFFYDAKGSRLFEDITRLPEYYLTRTEKDILKEIAPVILNRIGNKDIIELGSGDCSKISIIFSKMSADNLSAIRYIPVDVSHEAILKSAEKLLAKFPSISIQGILADFQKHLEVIPFNGNRLFCFFGSTIGNLSGYQSVKFLKDLKRILKPDDHFLLGLDMVKDIEILEKAYNDDQNITEAFNKNILNVVNQYVQSDFNPDYFEHVAFYNETNARIEMHLKALDDMEVSLLNQSFKIRLKKGETIHTENSHKYTYTQIRYFSDVTGLKIRNIHTDKNKWFSIVHLTA